MNYVKMTAVCAVFLANIATPVAAEEFNTQIVSYEDLNLSKKEGLRELNKRLERAISRVCYIPDSRSIEQTRQAGKCRRYLRSRLNTVVRDLYNGHINGTRTIIFKAAH